MPDTYYITPKAALDAMADAIRDRTSEFLFLSFSDTVLKKSSPTSAPLVFEKPLVAGNEYTITASFNRSGKSRNNSIIGTFTFSSYPISIPSGITVSSGTWDGRDALSIYETSVTGPNYTDEDDYYTPSIKIESVDKSIVFTSDGFADSFDDLPSGMELVASKIITTSSTSSTEETVDTWNTGKTSIWTPDKIVYIRIRDTHGKRTDYFYGSDTFIVNPYAISGSSTTSLSRSHMAQMYLRGTSSGYTPYAVAYGVYPSALSNTGVITLSKKYYSSYSGTINGRYKVEVYLIPLPAGMHFFT